MVTPIPSLSHYFFSRAYLTCFTSSLPWNFRQYCTATWRGWRDYFCFCSRLLWLNAVVSRQAGILSLLFGHVAMAHILDKGKPFRDFKCVFFCFTFFFIFESFVSFMPSLLFLPFMSCFINISLSNCDAGL